MGKKPVITLGALLEEVKVSHMDNAIQRTSKELKDFPEVDQALTEKIMKSIQATQITLGMSAMMNVPPPQASTALHIGIAMGIGVVLEVLNGREEIYSEEVEEEVTPPGMTVN
jgi:hypothetical protein